MTLETLATRMRPAFLQFSQVAPLTPNLLIVRDAFWLRHFDLAPQNAKFMGCRVIISENIKEDYAFAYAPNTVE